MDKLKNLSFIILPYIIICGGIYHMAFWSTFNLNGLSFISATEVVKSAAYPILSIFFALIIQIAVINFLIPFRSRGGEIIVMKRSNIKIIIIFLALFITGALIFYCMKWLKDPSTYILVAGFIFLFVSAFVANNDFLADQFENENLRRFVIDLIIIMPIISWFGGLYQSSVIYQNRTYTYTTQHNKNVTTNLTMNSDTLKFLGNTDDKRY
ncbi:MAG TPA: hypothetical protein VNX01_03895 [Bacteroidia bacterium]|jgi:hypothetical protein|nr:hypothetical protein [Bacteroidia bacterium]